MRQTAFDENLGTLEDLDEYGRRRRQQAQPIRRIPFDYVATFTLTGDPGRRVQALINISAEATFVCTSIGYGAEEPKTYQDYIQVIHKIREQKINDLFKELTTPKKQQDDKEKNTIVKESLVISKFFPGSLSKLAPISAGSLQEINTTIIPDQIPGEESIRNIIQNFRDALSFKYAIIDKGSGRELQNAPIHNLAGLGRLDGTRPFRELPVPYVFAPNSSVLIELTELVTLDDTIIHIDFQGYKEFR